MRSVWASASVMITRAVLVATPPLAAIPRTNLGSTSRAADAPIVTGGATFRQYSYISRLSATSARKSNVGSKAAASKSLKRKKNTSVAPRDGISFH